MKKDKYFGVSSRIARWKIDNWFENWLSYKSDNSELYKHLYISVPLKSGQININQTIPEKGKN